MVLPFDEEKQETLIGEQEDGGHGYRPPQAFKFLGKYCWRGRRRE